jgi:hypothetical protein
MRPTLTLLSALLPACAGTIEATGPDDFDTLASAAWVVGQLDGDDVHWILASDGPGLCGQLEDAWEGVAVAWEAWEGSNQGAGDCNDLWASSAEAWASFYDAEPTLLRVQMNLGDLFSSLEEVTAPHAGTYEVDANEVIVGVQAMSSNPLQTLVDTTPGCSWGELGEVWDDWSASSGTAEFEADGEDRWSAVIQAEIVEEGEDGASGTLEAELGASRCALPMGDVDWLEALAMLPVLAPLLLD